MYKVMTDQGEFIVRLALTSIIVCIVISIIGVIAKEKGIGWVEEVGTQVRDWAIGIAISIAVSLILWALLNAIWTMEIGDK